jgi:uncharacterized protein YpiB (UPF0302 family)
MTPEEIQEFTAKRRVKAAGRVRKFKSHIDPRTDQPHYPRNNEEALKLLDLATAARDGDAMDFYTSEIMTMDPRQ